MADVGIPAGFSGGACSSSSSGVTGGPGQQANLGQNFYHHHQQQQHRLASSCPDSSVTLSTTASTSSPRKKLLFYSMKRDSSAPGAADELDSRQQQLHHHPQQQQHGRNDNKSDTMFQPSCHTLPNHYIQDNNQQEKLFIQQQPSRDPRHLQRLQLLSGEPQRQRMELAPQPPPSGNPHIYHNFPHIIIGGQPFYLIPSDPDLAATFGERENSYAYPQNVPIYEEILEDSFSVSSDQGEVGSLSRPSCLEQKTALVNEASQVGAGHKATRVLVNPLVRDLAFQEFRPIQPHRGEDLLPVVGTAASPSMSQGSSIYYYSDTLKKPGGNRAASFKTASSSAGTELSDSGFSNRSPCPKMPLGSSSSSSASSFEAATSSSSSSPPSVNRSSTGAPVVDTQVVVVLDDQDSGLPVKRNGKATTLV